MGQILPRLLLTLIVSFSTATAFSQSQVIEKGQFSLRHQVVAGEFTSNLTDLNNFVADYTAKSTSSDLNPCPGRTSVAKVLPTHVDMCTSSRKLGYDIQVMSRFKATSLGATPACLATVRYELTILSGTRPELLLKNIQALSTHYCLAKNGSTVIYETSLLEGRDKGMLYPLIVREFKKLIPALNSTVQNLLN